MINYLSFQTASWVASHSYMVNAFLPLLLQIKSYKTVIAIDVATMLDEPGNGVLHTDV